MKLLYILALIQKIKFTMTGLGEELNSRKRRRQRSN
jgi:hypothetical protein